jgi:hypothetical protein
MASKDGELQYITLDDFSPGLFSNWIANGGAQPAPKGACQVGTSVLTDGTYGCVSGPNNCLMPGPKLVQTMHQGLIDTAAGVNQYVSGDAQMHALAFRVVSPVSENDFEDAQGISPFPDQIWIAWGWYLITDSPTNGHISEKCTIRTYFTYFTDFIGNATYPFASPTPAAPNIFDAVTHSTADLIGPPLLPQLVYGIASIDTTRANNAAPTSPGTVETVMCHNNAFSSGNVVVAFPKNSTPGVNSTEAIAFSANNIGTLFSHQDRIVGMRNAFQQSYGTNGFTAASEILEFTDVNNYSVVTTGGEIFVSEHPNGYGSWISMSANQLLLIKQRGGGVAVTGPLEQPTITYQPGIPSTLNAPNIGAVTPNGTYIYGTTRGIYEWTGGDGANLISPQFDGFFWRPTWLNDAQPGVFQVDKRYGQYGSFAYVNPFIFCPNNYLYNIQTGGWWRLNIPGLNNQTTYAFWDTNVNGLAIGCAAAVTNTSTVAADWYDTTQGQSAYQWVSHPLAESVNRELDFRELDMTVQANKSSGTIFFKFLDLNGNFVSIGQQQFTATNRPYTISIPIDVEAHDVSLVIQAQSDNGTDPAPTIYRVNLGYKQQETAR